MILGFILGVFVGALAGIFTIALVSVNGEDASKGRPW